MSRQGGIKGWEKKEDYNGEKVYYQRYQPEDEIMDPRYRGDDSVEGVIIRGNSDEGYVVIMDRRKSGNGNHSREFNSMDDARKEANRIMEDINEKRLFRENTSESEIMKIIEDIASDRASDQHWYYENLDASREIEKLAKFASKLN